MLPQPLETRPWYSQIGAQRDWIWRGWQIRYTYIRSDLREADRAPLVFLHGFGSAIGQWRYNLQPLSEDRTVYGLDLLGFGASQKAPAEYGAELWMAQVRDFWRSFIQTPIVLVGHSLGGAVALAVAASYPEMVRGLVLLTVPPSVQERSSSKLQAIGASMETAFASPLLLRSLFPLFRRPQVIRKGLQLAYVNQEMVTPELVALFADPPLDRGAPGVLCRLFRSKNRRDYTPNVKVTLPQLEMPILMLWGKQDRVIPLDWGRQLATLNPQLQFVEIENVGHCAYDECPDRVNQEIITWLKSHYL
ncbi:MAG: alpha/beta fold hydrolase [Hormoscilla sp.]